MSVHDHFDNQGQSSFFTSPAGLVLIGFLIIAGALLFTEHRAHVLRRPATGARSARLAPFWWRSSRRCTAFR
jgi:hypothetical protein